MRLWTKINNKHPSKFDKCISRYRPNAIRFRNWFIFLFHPTDEKTTQTSKSVCVFFLTLSSAVIGDNNPCGSIIVVYVSLSTLIRPPARKTEQGRVSIIGRALKVDLCVWCSTRQCLSYVYVKAGEIILYRKLKGAFSVHTRLWRNTFLCKLTGKKQHGVRPNNKYTKKYGISWIFTFQSLRMFASFSLKNVGLECTFPMVNARCRQQYYKSFCMNSVTCLFIKLLGGVIHTLTYTYVEHLRQANHTNVERYYK